MAVRPAPRWLPVLILLVIASGAAAESLQVPDTFPAIQEAIDAAADGDSIIVAAGEYIVGESITFRGKAITLTAAAGPARTRIRMSGSPLRGSIFIFENAEGADSVLEGFTLTGGVGTLMGSRYGGAILCLEGSRPTLKNLIASENAATYGGALCCFQASPTVVDCSLSGNHVTCGGGAYCDASSPVFIGCTVEGNRGSYTSSGIHSKNGSTPVLRNCRIVSNMTYYGGGVDSFESSPYLENCIIAANRAGQGGGVYVSRDAAMTLRNCTICGNAADQGADIIASAGLDIKNCIIWGYSPSPELDPPDEAHCLVGEDPLFVKEGRYDFENFNSRLVGGTYQEMPAFVLEEGDFHLRAGSLAIDAGDRDAAPPLDIDGTPRPQGIAPDIGAYEYVEQSQISFLRGDANSDGGRDIGDVLFMLGFIVRGCTIVPECFETADANDDGELDISDPVALLFQLFPLDGAGEGALPGCGLDTTPDILSCTSYPGCK
jgi:parallel beta-helix repeat protein